MHMLDILRRRWLAGVLLVVLVSANLFVAPSLPAPAYGVIMNVLIAAPLAYLVIFGPGVDRGKSFAVLSQFGALVFGLLFTALFVLEPRMADFLAQEDYIIEYATAFLPLVATLLFFYVAFRLGAAKQRLGALAAVVFGLGFFVVGMEEISWMQRIFDVTPPEFFAEHNMQRETNLHNLYTGPMMHIFYTVTFIFFVVVPFFDKWIQAVLGKLKLASLQLFVPPRWLVAPMLVSFIFASGAFSTTLVHVLMVACAFIIACYYIVSKRSDPALSKVALCVSLLIFFPCVLVFGSMDPDALGIRSWAVSEYRELLVCLVIWMYAADLALRYREKASQRLKRQLV